MIFKRLNYTKGRSEKPMMKIAMKLECDSGMAPTHVLRNLIWTLTQ
jgi:hypothetical protein